MNIFVTVLVLWRVSRATPFNWRLFLPFVIASVPMAFIGGAYTINSTAYKTMVGLALLLAMWRLLWEGDDSDQIQGPALWVALPVGALLGLVSGLTGVGGGIFLSPLLLLFNWTTMRGSAAIAAAFILFNSIASTVHKSQVMAGIRKTTVTGLAKQFFCTRYVLHGSQTVAIHDTQVAAGMHRAFFTSFTVIVIPCHHG